MNSAEIKWQRSRGGYTAKATDRSGRGVYLTARPAYEEWQWRAYEAGGGYEADGPPPRELASGIEDTLAAAVYAAEAWLAAR